MLKDCESVSESVSQWVSEIIEYRAAASQLKSSETTSKIEQVIAISNFFVSDSLTHRYET